MKTMLLRVRDSVYPFTFPKAVQAAVALTSLLVATACGHGIDFPPEVAPRGEGSEL